MLNVLKTVRFRFIIRVAAVWRVLWLQHYDISMQMGRILYFQNKKYAPTTTIAAAGTSCRHQILMERIETPNIRSLF
jgi:hypothetical protein